MTALGMMGPFDLVPESIDANIPVTSPGNYALGTVEDGTFYVSYVGRSDEDLNGRLKAWLQKRYTSFKFSYAPSSRDAFEKECVNFHDFGGTEILDNERHPARPPGSGWTCPICDIST